MDTFDKQFGLPPVNLQIISPLTVAEYDPRGDKPGWADETTLDVQIFHALAPDAKIVVLTSPVAETQGTIGLPEFRQLLQYSMDKKLGNIVSQSWGASELTLQDATGQQELARWNTLFEKGTTQLGMTFLASSGDNGSTDYADIAGKTIASVPTTSFPADSPWVTTVGGTTVNKDSGGNYSEIAWSKSGGGFSRFYKTPAYQQNGPQAVKEQLANRRGVPDVSGAADPYTGMAIYINGQWTLAGGTSASAPLWAGIVAVGSQMANRPLGFLNPGLYKIGDTAGQNAQDFRDIIQGNNTNANVPGYSAVPGWDPVTGLGSPLADKLLPDLIQETRADAGNSSAPAMERG
jgi:subtilase family serine protease